MSRRKRMLFVSPRFLFPADSGGKIRTAQILRGMKGGSFEITLLSPASDGAAERHRDELHRVADRFLWWSEAERNGLYWLTRLRHLLSRYPISTYADRSTDGRRLVQSELSRADLTVFDFAHAAVLAPERFPIPAVMFTHNVEAEIFKRHVTVAESWVKKAVWRNQYHKMETFERDVFKRFDGIVAVSGRDGEAIRRRYAVRRIHVIGTGVDLQFLNYVPPGDAGTVVFTGAMDWMANIDGIEYLMEEIWPDISQRAPQARMVVVGRNPPGALVRRAEATRPDWHFTGYVDDVRSYVQGASVYVIPLRVGGGTRIKAFEAMAMGTPVVSTDLGVEGLGLESGRHYLEGNDPERFAGAVGRLLKDAVLRRQMATSARVHVERHASYQSVARDFEAFCLDVASNAVGRDSAGTYDSTARA